MAAIVPASFTREVPASQARSKAQDLVDRQRERVERIANGPARRELMTILVATQRQIHETLARRPHAVDTWTHADAQASLVLVREAFATLDPKFRHLLRKNAALAWEVGVRGTVGLLTHLEKKAGGGVVEGGVLRPLALTEALALQRPLLMRHATSVDRYGQHMIGVITRELQGGIARGASYHEMVERLTGLRGPRGLVSLLAKENPDGTVTRLVTEHIPEGLFVRHRGWAERIVRTEMAHASNAGALDEMRAEKVQRYPDLQKKLIETFDRRTAEDSHAAHGQVRELAGLFVDGKGRQYDHPPGRPNDRGVVIPWRSEWGKPRIEPGSPVFPVPDVGDGAARSDVVTEPSKPRIDGGRAVPPTPAAGWERRSPVITDPAPAAPAPKALDATTIMGELVGPQRGSNAGGLYRGTDGVARYVKFYADPSQAWQEHLTNRIYQRLGVDAPESTVFTLPDGRTGYASQIIAGGKTLHEAGITEARAKAVMKGYAADVLLANWDAVGLAHDNVLVVGKRAVRIDNGGSLLFRAKAGRKPDAVLNDISEWDGFRSTSVNPAYSKVASVAGVAGDKDLVPLVRTTIRQAAALRKAGWASVVDQEAPGLPAADRAKIVGMLESRSALLEAKLKELTARPKKRKPGDEVVFDFESPDGRKVVRRLREIEQMTSARRAAYYDELAKRGGLTADEWNGIRAITSGWTSEGRSGGTHLRAYRAWENITHPGSVEKHLQEREFESLMQRAAETRGKRWELFLADAGVDRPVAPTHVRAHRGVSGKDWARDVAQAWSDETAQHVVLRSDPLASWSMAKSGADRFIASSSEAARLTWKVPFNGATVLDQVVDNRSFYDPYFREHEVISGLGHSKGVPVPKEDAVVKYRGTSYTYATRQTLIDEMKRRGDL